MSPTATLRLFALAGVALATLAGTLLDRKPARPVERRAGWTVLQADFHAHTRFSDGVLSPFDIVHLADRRALDVVAVTEHNVVFPAKMARAYASLRKGAPVVVVGEEITTRDYHVIALGLERAVDAKLPLTEALADVHAQGGVAIAAHPTRRFWTALEPRCADLDGAEVVHPIALRGTSVIGRASDMPAFADACAEERAGFPFARIGTSDYHFGASLGSIRSYVFVDEATERGVVEAVRAGRVATQDLDGRWHGPADLTSALECEPLEPRELGDAYAARGPLDAVARALGFASLVGLVCFGIPRRRGRSPRAGAAE